MKKRARKIACAILFAACASPVIATAQSSQRPAVQDVLQPATSIELRGYLADKLNESLRERIMVQDVDELIEPFKLANRKETKLWQTEFWGKWLTSAVMAYKYHPDAELKRKIDHAVDRLLATQAADGYIGNYAPDHRLEGWDIWGSKYCMLGLLAYYDLTRDKKSLDGAARITDDLMAELDKRDGIIVNKGNMKGMAASSILEPVCLLYGYTGTARYLAFAKEIVRQWETPQGPQLISKSLVNVAERFPKPKNWYGPEQGQKAYEMMSCYEGLLELYRLTGNEAYKIAVENAWQNIRDTEINIVGSGASTETWFGGKALQNTPVNHYQETCVTVTWLKLTDQLLRLTGEAKYADEAEKTYYNALLGAMSQHGAVWAKYTPLNGERLPGSGQCGMDLNCCVANGPRGLFNLPAFTVMARKQGIQVNYFAEGIYALSSPQKQNITLTQQTGYPRSGSVNMSVDLAKPEEMEIRIRIPGWSKETKLSVNGKTIADNVQPGQFAVLKRTWQTGDKITLELDMRGRIEKMNNTLHSFAILRGPLVLARDSRYDGAGIEAVISPVTAKDGRIELTEVNEGTKDAFMAFKARFMPESYAETPIIPLTITLCDYESAGNGQEHSFYKVWNNYIIDPRTNN